MVASAARTETPSNATMEERSAPMEAHRAEVTDIVVELVENQSLVGHEADVYRGPTRRRRRRSTPGVRAGVRGGLVVGRPYPGRLPGVPFPSPAGPCFAGSMT
ncbi:hypothetical protein GCM10010433_52060 [Streptomyces pulveraceus]